MATIRIIATIRITGMITGIPAGIITGLPPGTGTWTKEAGRAPCQNLKLRIRNQNNPVSSN
jgi:hypothetical protein